MPLRALFVLLFVGSVVGCGSTLVAPEDPASDAFLDQVDRACGKLSIGRTNISYKLDQSSNDLTFLDETDKLSNGSISAAEYRQSINAFYPAGDNEAAIECVLAQTPGMR